MAAVAVTVQHVRKEIAKARFELGKQGLGPDHVKVQTMLDLNVYSDNRWKNIIKARVLQKLRD